VLVARSLALFGLAALAELGGAYLIWLGLREDRGWLLVALGVLGLGTYGIIATFQPDPNFGRVFAAYGGVFIVGSILWGMAFQGFRPDRWDLWGGAVCLLGVGLIMFGPRP
jgi:small multidrug resistance family-3 protein